MTRLANLGGSPFTETLTVILSEPYWEDGQLKHGLLVASNYMKDACHACGAPVSGAIFTFQKNVWQLQLWDEGFAEIGANGYPPPVKLTRIGPRKYGFLFYLHYAMGAGSEDSLLLYSPLAGHITQLLSVSNVHIEAVDLVNPFLFHVVLKSQYGFIEGKSGAPYYDFHIIRWGDGTLYPAFGQETYVFNGSVYEGP